VILEKTGTLRSVLRCIALTLTLLTIVARAQRGPHRSACTGIAFQSPAFQFPNEGSKSAPVVESFQSAKHLTNSTP
jgi:hypothetical protein